MRIEILHRHVIEPSAQDAKLDAIHKLLQQLMERLQTMDENLQAEIDKLTATVAAETTVENKAIALLNGYQARLAAALADATANGATADQLAAVEAVRASIDTSSAALAAAVAAGTPAAAAN